MYFKKEKKFSPFVIPIDRIKYKNEHEKIDKYLTKHNLGVLLKVETCTESYPWASEVYLYGTNIRIFRGFDSFLLSDGRWSKNYLWYAEDNGALLVSDKGYKDFFRALNAIVPLARERAERALEMLKEIEGIVVDS